MREIDATPEGDLNDPARFAPMADVIPGVRPWRVVYDPGHLAEHGAAIRAWLER